MATGMRNFSFHCSRRTRRHESQSRNQCSRIDRLSAETCSAAEGREPLMQVVVSVTTGAGARGARLGVEAPFPQLCVAGAQFANADGHIWLRRPDLACRDALGADQARVHEAREALRWIRCRC